MDSWGKSLAMDVKKCNAGTIRNPVKIEKYIVDLCTLLDMKRYGECQVKYFGSDNKQGYTAVQLIETSCITAHFAEETNDAYVDVFSCKYFDEYAVADFTRQYFAAEDVVTYVCQRG